MLVVSLCAGSCAVQFFVKQIADTATDGYAFVPVVACIDTPNAVRADLGLAVFGRQRCHACTRITFLLQMVDCHAARLGATVVGKGQVGIKRSFGVQESVLLMVCFGTKDNGLP